jgi:glutathione synthase
MSYIFIIDSPANLNIQKDTTVHLMKEFMRQDKEIFCCGINDLTIDEQNEVIFSCNKINKISNKIELEKSTINNAKDFKTIFVRKDPPFDQTYLNATFIMDHISNAGGIVINPGSSLRNHNEKMGILHFYNHISPTLVSASPTMLKKFINENKKVILKPIDGMAGNGIFMASANDPNLNVILETMIANDQLIMAQKFIPDIKKGDKRIILIDGEPIPYALARIPQNNEIRANLAKGGKGIIQKISDKDMHIINTIKPYLKQNNFRFVGIDIIGEYLTEINVTSPTGLVEIEAQSKTNFTESIVNDFS